ncbi:MAG: methylated-DNA--[protein]-cysteine S-methyltransferase [Calditrichia bacterium]
MKIVEDRFFNEIIGHLVLGVDMSDQSLVYIKYGREVTRELEETPLHKEVKKQLSDYFRKKLTEFDIPYKFIQGTPFQRKVWEALSEIPYGEVVSYQHIAKKIGNPGAFRAVGNANNKNPIPIVIPCHRVVNTNNYLGGYAPGPDYKIKLLNLEGLNVADGKIITD